MALAPLRAPVARSAVVSKANYNRFTASRFAMRAFDTLVVTLIFAVFG